MSQKEQKNTEIAADSVGWVTPQIVVLANKDLPLKLQAGGTLEYVQVEFETYGELNEDRSNAVLVCHALSGDAHLAGFDATANEKNRPWRIGRVGWWDSLVGPGKALDTNKFFVICANVLGSCYGTTGPADTPPNGEKPYALDFPMVTVGDWVRLQERLINHLGIWKLHAVIGGSLGGQQALEWALAFPERVERCAVLAAAHKLSAQGLAFNAVGRHAIMHDPNFNNGNYYDGQLPADGLAAARMMAHITYLSEEGMDVKFGRRLRQKMQPNFDFGIEFEVESYLQYQGRRFVERFDANSYLYISRAMDYYDAAQLWGNNSLEEACSRLQAKTLIVSFSTDWLYTPEQCKELATAILRNGKPVSYLSVPSRFGHDAFLLEAQAVNRLLKGFVLNEN